jgi:carboxyl-terminal processing protease
LKKQGMEDLIIDLQDNGGGLLDVCSFIVDEFLDDNKLIVYSEGRRRPRKEYRATQKGNFEKGRLMLLINENSASASEIFSGSIQDWDRGLIVGRRSFGKGLVQQPISLADGSEMRLTIARYFTPSGRFIQKPYENESAEEYRMEKYNRYDSGELLSQDSISFPDSLKYQTLIKKRLVYGGGGIMPDVFVPIDTTGINELFRVMVRNGYFNNFSLDMINSNRDFYKNKFPNFGSFRNEFYKYFDSTLESLFLAYVKKENEALNYTPEEYQECKELIAYRLKAAFASNLYGLSESYEVSNEFNNVLKKAVAILQNKEYDKFGLNK